MSTTAALALRRAGIPQMLVRCPTSATPLFEHGTGSPAAAADLPIAPLGDAIPRRGTWLTRAIGRGVLALLGWRVTGAFPNEPTIVLIGAPHRSNWDFVIGLAAALTLRLGFSWVGKPLLFRPPAHWLLTHLPPAADQDDGCDPRARRL
ncbi:MAG: hypothetical protein OER21_15650 [Gemmatimonadota bacterium]|nr:hypothetical protein [Gemmatimonadota bacterium]